MTKLNKALVGTAAAAAMAVSASPATANDGRNNGPSTGEILAGVAVVGAIAAIASSGNRDRYRDNYYHGDRYNDRRYSRHNRYRHNNRYRHINQRQAVNRCVRAAENRATRRGRASVTDIRDVDRTRYGYRVKGRVLVERGWGGRHQRSRYADEGRFTCYIEGNRVSDVRFKGLRYSRR